MRRAVFTACLIAALVVPAGAEASQLIARDAKDITLRVNARGQALVGYRAKGSSGTCSRGARSRASPGGRSGAGRVPRRLLGRLGDVPQDRSLAGSSASAASTRDSPRLVRDGLHDAGRQPLGAPVVAVRPAEPRARPVEAAPGLVGAPRSAIGPANSRSSRSGRTGRTASASTTCSAGSPTSASPPTALPRRPTGNPADGFGRNIDLDTYNSAYGPWLETREQLPLPPRHQRSSVTWLIPARPLSRATPAVGRRPAGKGERYRATVVGPGVLPDVTWEAAAPGAYDEALDRQLAEQQRAVYGNDTLCKPL